MAELITALLTYGPLGVISAVVLKMYLAEKEQAKKDVNELNSKIQSLLETHARTLDDIRKAQTEREKEINGILQAHGESSVKAVEQLHELAERLWSIRK